MIDRLLHVLVCGIAEGFFLLVCALTHPAGSSKYGTSREKYATILQIKTSNELCALLDTTGKLRILSIYYRYMHILTILFIYTDFLCI